MELSGKDLLLCGMQASCRILLDSGTLNKIYFTWLLEFVNHWFSSFWGLRKIPSCPLNTSVWDSRKLFLLVDRIVKFLTELSKIQSSFLINFQMINEIIDLPFFKDVHLIKFVFEFWKTYVTIPILVEKGKQLFWLWIQSIPENLLQRQFCLLFINISRRIVYFWLSLWRKFTYSSFESLFGWVFILVKKLSFQLFYRYHSIIISLQISSKSFIILFVEIDTLFFNNSFNFLNHLFFVKFARLPKNFLESRNIVIVVDFRTMTNGLNSFNYSPSFFEILFILSRGHLSKGKVSDLGLLAKLSLLLHEQLLMKLTLRLRCF